MNTISREELKEKLDRGDKIKLVMAMATWAFQGGHIPGSLNISSKEDLKNLDKLFQLDDEIVVYCSSPECINSKGAYNTMIQAGYLNVRRYSGGVSDWLDAGYTLEREDQ